MPNKKQVHSMDEHLISSQVWEHRYICSVFKKDNTHLPMEKLKDIMLNLGRKGKPCRSRRIVYVGIRAHGYTYYPRKFKVKGQL